MVRQSLLCRALFLACTCACLWSLCTAQVNNRTFRVSAIDCKLEWASVPFLANVALDCWPLQNVHVSTDEPVLDQILGKAFELMKSDGVKPLKLRVSISNLHLSLEALTADLESSSSTIRTELQLNSCSIQSLKSDFFQSRLFSAAKSSGVVRFHNCKFAGVACTDLATAFDTSLLALEFVNCTWCPGAVYINNVNARDFLLHQPTAQSGLTLYLDEISVTNNLSVAIDSGWQPMRLHRVRPGHLTLTGVQLLGPLASDFLRDANLFSIRLRRCRLPEGAADDLFRNVKNVDRVLMEATDMSDLPWVRPGLSPTVLELSDCRLARLDFQRLAQASGLLELKLANASINQLPASWALVANGSVLQRLVSVDLTGNAIRRLPWVPNARRYSDSAHFVVLIGGNPLQCDCALKWLGAPSDDVRQVYRNDDPTCASPEHLRGKRVAEAFASFDPCASSTSAPPEETVASAGGSLLAIVIAVIVVLIVATVLLILCWKFKDRVCSRESHGKVKYTANKEEVTASDKTTMLMRGEEPRPTNV